MVYAEPVAVLAVKVVFDVSDKPRFFFVGALFESDFNLFAVKLGFFVGVEIITVAVVFYDEITFGAVILEKIYFSASSSPSFTG